MPEKHKDSYAYTARYNDAIYILEMVEPFLVISQKKLRAQMILKNYKSLIQRNGKYTSEQLRIKEEFYLHFMSL
jgi:hypothetical protein